MHSRTNLYGVHADAFVDVRVPLNGGHEEGGVYHQDLEPVLVLNRELEERRVVVPQPGNLRATNPNSTPKLVIVLSITLGRQPRRRTSVRRSYLSQ
jgi:hypothetical protein